MSSPRLLGSANVQDQKCNGPVVKQEHIDYIPSTVKTTHIYEEKSLAQGGSTWRKVEFIQQ